MHREIGLAILAIGACLGLITTIQWIGIQIDKAHKRAASQELSNTLADIPVIWEWPEGRAEEYFLGKMAYDPDADADDFIARMKADTDSFLAMRIYREDECDEDSTGRTAAKG